MVLTDTRRIRGRKFYVSRSPLTIAILVFGTGDPFKRNAIYLCELALNQNAEFLAFNASFESSIWSEIMVKIHGFPPIDEEHWHCVRAQAMALSLPRRLDYVAKVLKLAEQKDKEGAALMRKMCIIKTPTMPPIDPDELHRLGEYCKQDVIVEREIARKLPELSPHEQAIYVVDQRINKRGIELDLGLVVKGARLFEVAKKEANAELKKITEGVISTVGQTKVIKEYVAALGVELPNCQADTLDAELAKDEGELHPLARQIFELRRSTGRSAVTKYPAMLRAVCNDNRVRDHLMYCGAGRTRRWSGQRLQTQNIFRGYKKPYDIAAACAVLHSEDAELARMLFGSLMEVLAGLVRSMIIAKEGSRFITVDFSGIEARVLAAIVGNKRVLRDFDEGRDPYITMATDIYRVPYEEIVDEQRFFGKQAVLGLGYNMGGPKFKETCAKYGQKITLDFAAEIVAIYREKNDIVCRFWKSIERDAFNTISRHIRYDRDWYSLHWNAEFNAMVLTLPNGSERWYMHAKIEMREKWGKLRPTITYYETDSQTGKWVKSETYGGKLTENLIQSIARELQADAVLAVESAGWNIVLHAHDEIVCETPNGTGSVDELIQMMTTASPWASAWPIGADGWTGPRYRKE